MEHSLHVAVGHILSSITPVNAEKMHKASDEDKDKDKDKDKDNVFSAGTATFDNCSADLSHALSKLLGLIIQVWKSPQACAFFKWMCCEVNIPEHDLVLFVRTRWASMFACLKRALTLKSVGSSTPCQYLVLIYAQAITRFTQLVDESDNVPALRKKEYSDFHLSRPKWEQLILLHEVMKVSPHCFCPRSLCALFRY
jgi:hypothetical protein